MEKRNTTKARSKKNFKKSVIWNSIGSALNSFNSLFFLIIVTRINGLNEAGIFTLAYASACMFYIIGVYSGRTYQVTENNKKITDNEYIVNRIVTASIMLIVSLAFGIISNYYGQKMIIFMILCLCKGIEAICDVFHGILQKNERLDIVGKSLFFRSLIGLLVFLIVEWTIKNMVIASISLVIVDLFVLFLIDMKVSSKYRSKSEKIDLSIAMKILSSGFYVFGFSFIANYLVNAPRYAIDSLLTSDMQTIFGIIVMPASIIMLINQFIIQPIIIKLKEEYENKNATKFMELIYKVIRLTLLTGILAIIAAKFCGAFVLKLMYGVSLENYIPSLLLILGGATVYTVSSVLSNGMIVLRKTKVQLYIYITTAFFALFISYKMVGLFGFDGAIYSYLIIMIMLLILYIIAFAKILIKDKVFEV